MKFNSTLFSLIAALFIAHHSSGQTKVKKEKKQSVEQSTKEKEDSKDEVKFMFLQSQPSFPGGEEELKKFIEKNLKYPDEAKKNGHEGIVVVQFVVDPEGKISDINVVKQLGMGTNEEAVRLVNLMPKWVPAQLGGKPVSYRYTLPIRFSLN